MIGWLKQEEDDVDDFFPRVWVFSGGAQGGAGEEEITSRFIRRPDQ